MRRDARRDNNEHDLVKLAKTLGWWMIKLDQPCDFLGWRRGVFYAIEVKNPDCENHADEFTARQKQFHVEAHKRGATIMIWRTTADVFNASGARISA